VPTVTAGQREAHLVPPGVRPVEPSGDLTLCAALALTLTRSPALIGVAWSVREAEAWRLQAGLLPNPEMEVELENFAGSGEFQDSEALETTFWFAQLIETAGKREKRVVLAGWDAKLAGWDYEALRLELFAATTRRFVRVLVAQRRLVLAREAVTLAERTLDHVTKRVAAGKSAPAAKAMATAEAASMRVGVIQAASELEAARHSLASMWDGARARYRRVVGSLERMCPLPSKAALLACLPQSPRLARWDAEIRRRRAKLELERARAVPDLDLVLGYRQFSDNDDDDRAMVAGVAVALPVFNRNQGEIRRARLALLRARAERSAVEANMYGELSEAFQALVAGHRGALLVRDEVLPAARTAFRAGEVSFRQGKIGYNDLLEIQRKLIGARREYVDALAAYHKAVADVEVLISRPLASPVAPTPKKGGSSP
jgi:cobalt-zinc-cadmium efflux system outer membrane protein